MSIIMNRYKDWNFASTCWAAMIVVVVQRLQESQITILPIEWVCLELLWEQRWLWSNQNNDRLLVLLCYYYYHTFPHICGFQKPNEKTSKILPRLLLDLNLAQCKLQLSWKDHSTTSYCSWVVTSWLQIIDVLMEMGFYKHDRSIQRK